MCRNAKKNGVVTVASTLKAVGTSNAWENVLGSLPYMQKTAVLACRQLSQEMNLGQLYMVYKSKCKKLDTRALETNEFLDMIGNLASLGVVSIEGKGSNERLKTMRFNV